MRPGRLPEDHPREQQARDRLRQLSPEAQAKTIHPAPNQPTPQQPPRSTRTTRRWT